MKKHWTVMWTAAIAAMLAGAGGAQAMENRVRNPSFEEVEQGAPLYWRPHEWQGEGRFEAVSGGRTGGQCVSIASEQGADLSWESMIRVKPHTLYRLSGWIKTENVAPSSGLGALFNLHGTAVRTPAVTGTQDWTRVEAWFETEDWQRVHLNCLFGGWGKATGAAWFDDVAIEEASLAEFAPAATIQAGNTGAPISPYVYGQFIEHLGRCIYGGIWAEMLEDRKFYYPVGVNDSPWRALGAVKMDADRAYVGKHCAAVTLDGGQGGIVQGGLGLEQGKRYVGRVVLAAEGNVTAVSAALSWGEDEAAAQRVPIEGVGAGWNTFPLDFTAGASTECGVLTIEAAGTGVVRIGTASLMPADNVDGMRADTLALLKELDAPIYRWPGGNFVSGYDWRDGIGDPDKRPPRKNPAWKGVEHNDFGLDEFMTFCRAIGTEPLIVVNSGLGELDMALAELEYVNGPADSPMGRKRAQNGRRAPYGVAWWGVGNEMYGDWQLGHMPLEEYVKKHNTFAAAMREQEPDIKIVAVGATGPWSETMLAQCADYMDALSEHFYCGEKPGLITHVQQTPNAVRAKADAHRRYHREIAALEGKSIPIALDEWNYWYGPHLYGELGTRYFLKDALGIAEGIHEMARNSDVFYMANYAQTVNVIGAVKTSKTRAAFATTGLVLKLYRAHYGVTPVKVAGSFAPLDVAAAWNDARTAITVGVVNPTEIACELPLGLEGAAWTGAGVRHTLTGPGPMAYNEPGKPPQAAIETKPVEGFEGVLFVPPVSVMLAELNVNEQE